MIHDLPYFQLPLLFFSYPKSRNDHTPKSISHFNFLHQVCTNYSKFGSFHLPLAHAWWHHRSKISYTRLHKQKVLWVLDKMGPCMSTVLMIASEPMQQAKTKPTPQSLTDQPIRTQSRPNWIGSHPSGTGSQRPRWAHTINLHNHHAPSPKSNCSVHFPNQLRLRHLQSGVAVSVASDACAATSFFSARRKISLISVFSWDDNRNSFGVFSMCWGSF